MPDEPGPFDQLAAALGCALLAVALWREADSLTGGALTTWWATSLKPALRWHWAVITAPVTVERMITEEIDPWLARP